MVVNYFIVFRFKGWKVFSTPQNVFLWICNHVYANIFDVALYFWWVTYSLSQLRWLVVVANDPHIGKVEIGQSCTSHHYNVGRPAFSYYILLVYSYTHGVLASITTEFVRNVLCPTIISDLNKCNLTIHASKSEQSLYLLSRDKSWALYSLYIGLYLIYSLHSRTSYTKP